MKIILRGYSVLEKIKNWIDSIADSLKTLKIQPEPFISKRIFSMFQEFLRFSIEIEDYIKDLEGQVLYSQEIKNSGVLNTIVSDI